MEKIKNKSIGMVHIPGVNDRKYFEYKSSLPVVKEDPTAMISVVDNRW